PCGHDMWWAPLWTGARPFLICNDTASRSVTYARGDTSRPPRRSGTGNSRTGRSPACSSTIRGTRDDEVPVRGTTRLLFRVTNKDIAARTIARRDWQDSQAPSLLRGALLILSPCKSVSTSRSSNDAHVCFAALI